MKRKLVTFLLAILAGLSLALGFFACGSENTETEKAVSGDPNCNHVYMVRTDEAYHWRECQCGKTTEKLPHSFVSAQDETHHWTECECGGITEKFSHDYVFDKYDENKHWYNMHYYF